MTEQMVGKPAHEAALATPDAPAMPVAGVLSKLGHELRGPLAGIIGLTRILLANLAAAPPDLAKQRRQLEMILSTGRRSLATVERVVDVVKIESGGLTGDRRPTDCRVVVADVTDAFRAAAEQRGAALRADLPDEPVMLTTDAGLLARALRELVDNAVKYADPADVLVRIRTDDDGFVMIEVSDEGPGIPAGDQTRIFGAFERGEGAAQRDEDGSGLGLYLARLLTDLLGAELSLRSDAGRPAVFTVTFPAASRP